MKRATNIAEWVYRLLFLCFGICLVSCSTAKGQSINFGLKGGVAYTTYPVDPDVVYTKTAGRISPSFGARLMIDFPKIQFGAAADYATMSNTYRSASSYVFYGEDLVYHIGIPMYPVCLFANYKVQLPKSYFYFGLNAGYTFFSKEEKTSSDQPARTHDPNLKPIISPMTPQSSVNGGLQFGYNIALLKGINANAELRATAIPIEADFNIYDDYLRNYSKAEQTFILYLPLSIGLNYAF